MNKPKTITREQAEAALAAVKAQFAAYIEPLVINGHDYGPTVDSQPVLVEDYEGSGHWAISWEEGPDDWAYRASVGGTSEEERTLAGQAAEEFGVPYERVAPRPDEPIRVEGVHAEPHMSFILGLYPL
jgi:hypothetical protein